MSQIFLTGTAVYGPFTSKSDIDIVMDIKPARYLAKLLKWLKIPINTSSYGRGFWFNLDFAPKIQIIIPDTEHDMKSWHYATAQMRTLQPIIDRNDRLLKFKHFRSEFKHD